MVDETLWPRAQERSTDDRVEQQRQSDIGAPLGRLRPARGFLIGLLASTPLWALLVLLVRSLLSWLR